MSFRATPTADLKNGTLDLIVDFVQVQDAPPLAEGNIGLHLNYDASRDESATARARVKRVIDRYRDRFIEREAEKLGSRAPSFRDSAWKNSMCRATRKWGVLSWDCCFR